jgi:hypothetical protein
MLEEAATLLSGDAGDLGLRPSEREDVQPNILTDKPKYGYQ